MAFGPGSLTPQDPLKKIRNLFKRTGPALLTQRAERNVDQDNERALRKTFILEDSLINVAVLEDLRAFEATRDPQEVERKQQASREEPGAATRESEPVRETFTREAASSQEHSDELAPERDEPAFDIDNERDGGRER